MICSSSNCGHAFAIQTMVDIDPHLQIDFQAADVTKLKEWIKNGRGDRAIRIREAIHLRIIVVVLDRLCSGVLTAKMHLRSHEIFHAYLCL